MRILILLVVALHCIFSVQTSEAALGDFLGSVGVATGQQRGLVWDGTSLWLTNQAGPTLYEIDPANGNILNTIGFVGMASSATQGLAWDGTNFYVSALDVIYKVDPSGSVLDSHNFGLTMWGLEWNGSRLLAVDNLDNILTINIGTWGVDTTLSPGIVGLDGLAWDGSTVWVAQQSSDTIYQLNASTGAVITSFTDTAAGSITDLTVDGAGNILAADDALNSIRTYEGPGASATPLSLGGWMGLISFALGMAMMVWFAKRQQQTQLALEGAWLAEENTPPIPNAPTQTAAPAETTLPANPAEGGLPQP